MMLVKNPLHYELANWYLVPLDDQFIYAAGNVSGSLSFPEGMYVHTSVIQSAQLQDNALIIQTKNSVYHCALDRHSEQDEDLYNIFPRLLPNWTLDDAVTLHQILEAQNRKRWEEVSAKLASFLPRDGSNCVILALDTEMEGLFYGVAWRVNGKSGFTRSHTLTPGFSEDTVRFSICGEQKFQICYELCPPSEMRLCPCPDLSGPLCIYNEGTQVLTFASSDFTCSVPPGQLFIYNPGSACLNYAAASGNLPVEPGKFRLIHDLSIFDEDGVEDA